MPLARKTVAAGPAVAGRTELQRRIRTSSQAYDGRVDSGTGRMAVVTGGNRGICREVARQLGDRGCTVILGSRGDGRRDAQAWPVRLAG
jgi:hypothetical protein